MKGFKKLSKNKKGISSLFIAIYVFLLATILVSTLFVSLNIGKSGLTTYMKIEQERIQEGILIGGPGGMQLDGDNVKSLRVNNTGSIAVRIRSLYIGQTFKCDPSTFDGDSYIDPKESLWIQLSGNIEINYDQTKKSIWTVTTERGIKSQERGDYILEGPYADPDTSNIRIGPFQIAFEEFDYSKDDGASWLPGWSIPSGTKVIFRIEITNIDDEAIILTDTSCFALHANDDIPNNRIFWYIRPPPSGYLIIQPYEEVPTPIIYDRIHAGQSPQTPNFNFQPGYTAVNYLIFTGYYADAFEKPDLSKPIAQTIPFEAVLATEK